MDDKIDKLAISKMFFESVKAVNHLFNSQLDGTLEVLLEILPGQYDNVLTPFIKEYMTYLNSYFYHKSSFSMK